MKLPRLDILIYAHDGRGLGHASRSISIGMALRRLYPDLRVLFVSGCKVSQELIGAVGLDWLKLPSYETEVVGGKSQGIVGNSMFTDIELGEIRTAQIAGIVNLYRPRLVLCDHTPQGKHREIVQALEATATSDTRWILGVRGVVGAVSQAKSELARNLFTAHYHSLLWYGDSAVLGKEHLLMLKKQYGVTPKECGYVSRMREMHYVSAIKYQNGKKYAGTVAIPWLGEQSLVFLSNLAEALRKLGAEHGQWHIFVDTASSPDVYKEVERLFGNLSYCLLEPPSGRRYVESLLTSRSAVIYGGYNSVMDVLALNLPSLVILREMQDNEQQIHLEKLSQVASNLFHAVSESEVKAEELVISLLAHIEKRDQADHQICLDGAENAARTLWQMLPSSTSL